MSKGTIKLHQLKILMRFHKAYHFLITHSFTLIKYLHMCKLLELHSLLLTITILILIQFALSCITYVSLQPRKMQYMKLSITVLAIAFFCGNKKSQDGAPSPILLLLTTNRKCRDIYSQWVLKPTNMPQCCERSACPLPHMVERKEE